MFQVSSPFIVYWWKKQGIFTLHMGILESTYFVNEKKRILFYLCFEELMKNIKTKTKEK